jgi:predicted nucleic acid-binding Zn finger protein
MMCLIKQTLQFCWTRMDYFCLKRYGRAMTQRIYLIDYAKNKNFWTFTIQGSQEKKYSLYFSKTMVNCTCHDFQINLEGCSPCKHLLYVFARVCRFNFEELQRVDFHQMLSELYVKFDDMFSNELCTGDGDLCVICFHPLQDNCFKCDKCKNLLHFQCIQTWLKQKQTCPFCRTIVTLTPMYTCHPPVEHYVSTNVN